MRVFIVSVMATLLLANVSSSTIIHQVLKLLDPVGDLEEQVFRLCLERNTIEGDTVKEYGEKDDLTQCFVEPKTRKSRSRFNLNTTLFRLIYNIIGRTGHSAKSLRIARQMNVSSNYFLLRDFIRAS